MTTKQVVYMLLAMLVAAAVSFASTPMVKALACKVGAIDVPKDNRRMHKVPIPRMGGLAIFLAFLLSVLVFADIDRQMQGILLGSIMIVILGVLDDIMALKALPKLFVQIAAAASPSARVARSSSSPTPTSSPRRPYLNLGWLSVPVTIIWIVAHHQRRQFHRRPRRPCRRRVRHLDSIPDRRGAHGEGGQHRRHPLRALRRVPRLYSV